MEIKPIIEALLNTPYAKVNDPEHLYVRCPLCGDSMKHQDGAHCGIWIRPGQPLIYHCWICDESGIVNTSFMESLGITNGSVLNDLNLLNRAGMKGAKLQSTFHMRTKDWNPSIPVIQDTKNNQEKLEYMRSRLGIPFTYKSLEGLRIIFSLDDFLKLNHLRIHPKYQKSRFFLNRDYVGFLSTTKDMITFRNIRDSKYRYIKYPVFENNPLEMQSYTLPSQVNMLEPSVDLHLAEGTFDILGVFFHIQHANLKNQIYSSVCGSAYKKTIQYFLRKGFLTNLNIHIYSDRDKDLDFYRNIYYDYAEWFRSFHVYYNMKSKDTGVTKDEIEEVESVWNHN